MHDDGSSTAFWCLHSWLLAVRCPQGRKHDQSKALRRVLFPSRPAPPAAPPTRHKLNPPTTSKMPGNSDSNQQNDEAGRKRAQELEVKGKEAVSKLLDRYDTFLFDVSTSGQDLTASPA